jgi:hypothetical protein
LLFSLKVIENKEEIKNLFKLFIKEHFVMFQSNHKQEINTILFNILEEFSLLDVFNIEDIVMINNIALEKYKKLFDYTKKSVNKYLIENNLTIKNNNNKNNNLLLIENENFNHNAKTENYFEKNLNFQTKIDNVEKFIFSDLNECKCSILSMINTYYLFFLKNKNISLAENLFKVNLKKNKLKIKN